MKYTDLSTALTIKEFLAALRKEAESHDPYNVTGQPTLVIQYEAIQATYDEVADELESLLKRYK